ncbi:MAG: GNAT family N-acetyltransferase [Actinopolymorphaceae bacterium]
MKAADLRVPALMETPRLTLRTWRRTDWSAFAAINADPRVMEHLGGTPGASRATPSPTGSRTTGASTATGCTPWNCAPPAGWPGSSG